MISKADAHLVHRFVGNIPEGDDITSVQRSKSEIEQFKQDLDFNESDFTRIHTLFTSKQGVNICTDCSKSMDNCRCSDPEYETSVFEINIDRLVDEWIDTIINNRTIFTKFELKNSGGEPWVIMAETTQEEVIRFRLYFSERGIKTAESQPYSLEFPIGFISSEYIVKTDHVFSWAEFLEHDFDGTFREILSEVQEPITKPFYDYQSEIVNQFKSDIFESMFNFLDRNGYDPSDEVEDKIREAGNIIDISKVDIVAQISEDDSKLLICHCNHKKDKWHMHRYRDGEMITVDDLEIANDLQTGVRARASKFKQISSDKNNINTAIKSLIPVIGLLSFAPIIDFLSLFEASVSSNQEILVIVQAVLTIIVTLVLLTIVGKPHWDSWQFDWEIKSDDLK
jgi:hypothetical protein